MATVPKMMASKKKVTPFQYGHFGYVKFLGFTLHFWGWSCGWGFGWVFVGALRILNLHFWGVIRWFGATVFPLFGIQTALWYCQPSEFIWLVVEPTHLKNMRKSNGKSSPSRDEHKKYLSCHHLVMLWRTGIFIEKMKSMHGNTRWPLFTCYIEIQEKLTQHVTSGFQVPCFSFQ